MTRTAAEVEHAMRLLDSGLSQAEVARSVGVPRSTLRDWITAGPDVVLTRRRQVQVDDDHRQSCAFVQQVPEMPYAYLLGLYLGDGCLSRQRADIYRLRISLDFRYPGIIDECEAAMGEVLPNKVGRVACPGCASVNSYSRHWLCLFPQHAPGLKHLRPIVLTAWQTRIALESHPRQLLRGLIHSDGYCGMNRIGARYSYPRYMFKNSSPDIRQIFTDACMRVGIEPTQCRPNQVSVARRDDVALMDTFIGPKR